MRFAITLAAPTYNASSVTLRRPSRIAASLLALIAFLFATANAQDSAASADPSSSISPGRILLVLPFDNLTPSVSSGNNAAPAQTASSPEASSLDWLREAAPDILNARFTSAGLTPLTREDRLYALDHLGLPATFNPSRATAIRIAQTLDAQSICIGSYSVANNTLTLRAHWIDVNKLRLDPEVTETGPLAQLIPLLNGLAWQLTRQLDPSFAVAKETFRAAGSTIRLDAFEQYIRGISERDPVEQLKHLKHATELSPDFPAAWLAIAKIQFAQQDYEDAAVSFGKVAQGFIGDDPAELEATFYRGLSLIFSGNYPRAEEAFSAVARVLPLPEVVNNQAVAQSRRGHDATPLYRQASAADPADEDYHFNLAVSLHHHNDNAGALAEITQALKIRPTDSEAKAAQQSWQSGSTSSDPLERIKRSYNGAAFRQAALMAEQVEETRLATLPAPERASRLSKSAREKLDRGLLTEAERGYQAALAADTHSAEAHAGLAQVRERSGDTQAARSEANAALARQPNLDAYMVLARLDLAANNLAAARDEANAAVKLDSSSRAAKDLRKVIENRIETAPATPAATPAATTPASTPSHSQPRP
jgi:tetratricopeptide (TPR) repeat protein